MTREDPPVLTILHTADWHLGKRFKSFSPDAARTLEQARLAVLDEVFSAASRYAVHAVLCAGDLFDSPSPDLPWWEGLVAVLRRHRTSLGTTPVFLLPGNHDPLTADSIWKDQRFRSALPDTVTVVDREMLEVTLPGDAVLYAVPCLSAAGQADPTRLIPARASGDGRIRIGLVHGATYDEANAINNFPIDRDAAVVKGLDYLAIGDTHGHRLVPPDRLQPATVYPGTPEPTAFAEKDPGSVAVVRFTRRRHALIDRVPVARWTWEDRQVRSLDELRALGARDLRRVVLRLDVDLELGPDELEEARRLLDDLAGNEARSGAVGILDLVGPGPRLDVAASAHTDAMLPDVLRAAAVELRRRSADPRDQAVAERALEHLLRLVRTEA